MRIGKKQSVFFIHKVVILPIQLFPTNISPFCYSLDIIDKTKRWQTHRSTSQKNYKREQKYRLEVPQLPRKRNSEIVPNKKLENELVDTLIDDVAVDGEDGGEVVKMDDENDRCESEDESKCLLAVEDVEEYEAIDEEQEEKEVEEEEIEKEVEEEEIEKEDDDDDDEGEVIAETTSKLQFINRAKRFCKTELEHLPALLDCSQTPLFPIESKTDGAFKHKDAMAIKLVVTMIYDFILLFYIQFNVIERR
jgi:hypothetical protein